MTETNAVPRQVREQAEHADAMWRERYGGLNTEESEPEEPATAVEPEQAGESDPAQPTDWEHRFKVLKGKYDSEVPRLSAEVKQLRDQAQQANDRAANAETKLADAQANAPVDLSEKYSADEIETYGEDTLRLVEKARRDGDRETEQRLRKEFQDELAQRDAQANRSREQMFWDRLASAVPDWQTVNDDPEFHRWLEETVLIQTGSGMEHRPRQSVLEGYQSDLNAGGVIELFQAFEKSTDDAPNRPREAPPKPQPGGDAHTGAPQGEPAVSRAQMKQIHTDLFDWRRRNPSAPEEQMPEALRARKQALDRAMAAGRIGD
jgi:hypothetical protein